MPGSLRLPLALFLAALLALTAGCAAGPNPRDPWEKSNRAIFEFNQAVDRVALKPVAQGYEAAVPLPVRGGINNVFGNFRDVTTTVNQVLQGKIKNGFSDLARVLINSTVGMFGVFDVATHLGLERHDEDFGQTLGVWGFKSGPYMVLPFLGPSTVRDTVGLVGDYFTDPEFVINFESPWNYIIFGTRYVNARANLLSAEKLLNQAAIDRYAFIREAYLQRRISQIYDGLLPEGTGGAGPRRKTLKEMEEEFGVDEPNAPPPAPAKPEAGPQQ